jgi:hypothetical protein
MKEQTCKICGGNELEIFAHTATCNNCRVLLYFPYPQSDTELIESGVGKDYSKEASFDWCSKSSFFNHHNFTQMLRFVMDESFKYKNVDVLDYG